ncbi:cation:proton antiporter [Ramlibacter tataouinensis]|uniref:Candidate Na+/H+ and K+/H+ antiporter, NhaP type n=1 Tax=Ramlibacter tataouinensis (strain ATCC BAA-407 / DSM 14655 / LMG 21543 / TTB310) TaxID=365046 RepID=F5Y2M3_RAMTT|nr:cation:proton antiporter [Ramlibacter tataouinensis]AEG92386.1 Candidate Na+/H+ and K+/H+ antiporter, NhaP type [Ramlibacter tataouinensis TTB310]
MEFALWSVLVGALLILMALSATVLSRLPLSTSMLYLAVGLAVSPLWLGWVKAGPLDAPVLLERMTEIAVIVSLFTAGLKLSPGLRDRRWRLPLRLAVNSMIITVFAIAAVGYLLLGLPLGGAILLGAILAPTDPVLASEVQIHQPGDRDKLRFALTGEGGLNDGTAFPFVMLGLGLLGLHEIGPWGWRWLAVDVLWATTAGLGLGALLGAAVGKLVLYLRREHKEAVGLDDFLALGLIGLSYGLAILAHAYGFLAVFAAGVALRHLEQSQSDAPEESGQAVQEASIDPDRSLADSVAVDPRHAPAFMAQAVLGFNQQIERIGEVTVVIAIGSLLWAVQWEHAVWWFVPLLLLGIRPAAVLLGMAGSHSTPLQRGFTAWFGIRGIGSLYYLMYAINHGLAPELAQVLVALTLSVVVSSIVVHGISVTPLMAAYEKRAGRR